MKLLCFGDSNTWGFDPRDWFGGRYEQPWPQLLAEQTGHTALNCGENGRTIPASPHSVALLDRLLKEQRPDKLLLMLGTNDILSLFPNDPGAVALRMDRLISHLKETFPTLPILLIAPPPAENAAGGERLTAELEQVALQQGAAFIDAGAWDIPLAHDGIHFTAEGHRRFALHMAQKLSGLGEGVML